MQKTLHIYISPLILLELVISLSVDVEFELSEAESYCRAMDVEFRMMPSADKKTASSKLNEYKDEYKQLLQTFTSTKQAAEAEALKSSSSNRAHLISANQRLDNTTASLEESRRIIASTEDIGGKIMADMENQKEMLIGAKENVDQTKDITWNAGEILKEMARRAIYNKICLLLVITFLAGLIGITIYYGFGNDK